MRVETSNTKIIKQNYCIFCSKLQTQLARHLETVHHNEPDVKKFAVLPKKTLNRKKLLICYGKMVTLNLIRTPN